MPQTLCLISLMYYNYVFSVDQLSQNRETNYHHYLQLFFTFSLSFFVSLVSLLMTKCSSHSCSFVVLCLNIYLAVNHLLSKELFFPLLLFPSSPCWATHYFLHIQIGLLGVQLSNKTKDWEQIDSF